MRIIGSTVLKGLLLASLGCASPGTAQSPAPAPAPGDFPQPLRPVAAAVSPAWDDEYRRDRNGEAARVIEALRIGPGVRVADIGAGTGYYTFRIAARLGPAATIYAQDVNAAWLAELRARLDREMLYSVTTVLGTPADPGLPPQSVDIALLGHMYHEIESPYEFLYNLHSAIAPGGRVAVVDVDQETRYHGTPAGLLRCEFEAVGYRQVDFVWLASAGYLAVFELPDRLPAVADIEACGEE